MSLANSEITYFTMRLLAGLHRDLELIELGAIPNRVDPAASPYTNLAFGINMTGQPDPPTAIIVCGLHGRELMNTQSAIYFVAQLMGHLRDGSDWDVANMHYPDGFGSPELVEGELARSGTDPWKNDSLRTIFESLRLIIVPNANPNGRDINFAGIPYLNREPGSVLPGRKNLRPVEEAELTLLWDPIGPCGSAGSVGVDLNRNFGFLFGHETARSDSSVDATTSRCRWSNQFCGPEAVSEVESQMIQQLVDDHPATRLFIDTHSYATDQGPEMRMSAGFVLHPWAFAATQTTDPSQTVFSRPCPIDPARERWTPETEHAEYMPPDTLRRFQDTAALVATRSSAFTIGNGYLAQSGLDLYPVTGDSSESAFARQFEGYNRDSPIFGWALETGRDWWEVASPSINLDDSVIASERFERTREILFQGRDYDEHINGTIGAWLTLLESAVY